MMTFPTARLAALGVDLPPQVQTVNAIRAAVDVTATSDPVGAVSGALLEGKLTPDKAEAAVLKAARELVERDKVREVARDLAGTLERLERRALRESGDQMVQAMRPAFAEAVAAVTASVEQFGPEPNDSAILAAGPAAVAGWEARNAAVHNLANVHAVRNALQTAGYGDQDHERGWYLKAAASADDLDRAGQAWNAGKFAGLLAAGFELNLNTAAEGAAVVAAASAASEQARQAERDRRKQVAANDPHVRALRKYGESLAKAPA